MEITVNCIGRFLNRLNNKSHPKTNESSDDRKLKLVGTIIFESLTRHS
jgi:hypothetical protein